MSGRGRAAVTEIRVIEQEPPARHIRQRPEQEIAAPAFTEAHESADRILLASPERRDRPALVLDDVEALLAHLREVVEHALQDLGIVALPVSSSATMRSGWRVR